MSYFAVSRRCKGCGHAEGTSPSGPNPRTIDATGFCAKCRDMGRHRPHHLVRGTRIDPVFGEVTTYTMVFDD